MSSSSSSSSLSFSSSFLAFADLETGLSDNTHFMNSSYNRRRRSYRALGSMSPRSGSGTMFFCDALSDDETHHFLDACYLCKKPLGSNRDIFMYRGDTPFCSEECRQEQIEMDEAEEKKWSVSRKEQQKHKSEPTSPSKSTSIHIRTGTVVAG